MERFVSYKKINLLMASTPTFDYLTITVGGQDSTVRYIAKSRSINFTGSCNQFESYKTMLDSIRLYLTPEREVIPKEGGEVGIEGPIPQPKFSVQIPLIKIYANSITIRTTGGLRARLTLPLRNNQTNQLIKIPFATISDGFASEVAAFIVETDTAASVQNLHLPG